MRAFGISFSSENLEKTINVLKAQKRNADLKHENIKILQNKIVLKDEIIKLIKTIKLRVFDSLSKKNNPTISDLQQ